MIPIPNFKVCSMSNISHAKKPNISELTLTELIKTAAITGVGWAWEFVLRNSHVSCGERPLHIHRTACATYQTAASAQEVKRNSCPLIRADMRGNLTIHLPAHLPALSAPGPGTCLFLILKSLWHGLSKGRCLNIWHQVIIKTRGPGRHPSLTLDRLCDEGLGHLQASLNRFRRLLI